jgi:hypothetical protein
MSRSFVLIVFAAAACSAACGRPSGGAPSSAGAPAATSAAAANVASAHPPSDFAPPADPYDLPEPEPMQIPNDSDPSPDGVAQRAVHVPTSSPIPEAVHALTPLPKTHFGDAKPFECLSHDECYFPRMPFYNQGNPNFAHVELPKKLYDSEAGKITGPMAWDDATNSWAIVLKPKTAKTLDPYYATWLPFGPISKKDDGWIGYVATMICAPTSESMALMAALAAKSASSKVKPGTFTDRFVRGERPEGQAAAISEPLLHDHSNRAPDSRQMTAEDLQRVVDMAIRQGTNPLEGGNNSAILGLEADFEPVDGKSPVHARSGGRVTNEMIIDAIRDHFAVTIVAAGYRAKFTPVKDGAGKLVKYTLTFARNMGHILAVNGFSMDADGPSLLLYNPVYATPTRKRILKIPSSGLTKDGVPVEVKGPEGGDYLSILHEISEPAKKPVMALTDITDGLEVFFWDGYAAIKID